ncbi:MAG: hypothetical protein MJZ11_04195 [Lachnospiraceae bacterium]|nr:hypothetical protein [Lachnospiraceae bacterium]
MNKYYMNNYINPSCLYDEAQRRYNEITNYCQLLEKRIHKYPPGKIHTIKTNGKVQYYLRATNKDVGGEYISKSDKQKILLYLQKKYDEKAYALLNKEQKSILNLIEKSNDSIDKFQSLYSDNPSEIKNYITPLDLSDDDYAMAWIAEKYIGKEVPTNTTVYTTNKGESVRSKSELNIANTLEQNGIPYKYECPLTLNNGKIIYPDFTILNKRKRNIYYWEHRGMMDDREYAKHTVQRIKELSKSGIIIGKNLIITEETQAYQLGTDEIDMMIKTWFL